MLSIKKSGNTVHIDNCKLGQLTLTRNPKGEFDATIGAATVGANSTSNRVAAEIKPNVSADWISNTLDEAGCSNEDIEVIFQHLSIAR